MKLLNIVCNGVNVTYSPAGSVNAELVNPKNEFVAEEIVQDDSLLDAVIELMPEYKKQQLIPDQLDIEDVISQYGEEKIIDNLTFKGMAKHMDVYEVLKHFDSHQIELAVGAMEHTDILQHIGTKDIVDNVADLLAYVEKEEIAGHYDAKDIVEVYDKDKILAQFTTDELANYILGNEDVAA